MKPSDYNLFEDDGNDMYNRSLLHVSVIDSISKTKYVLISLIPIYVAILIAIGYPKLISTFAFFRIKVTCRLV